jgi:hypothetical protein
VWWGIVFVAPDGRIDFPFCKRDSVCVIVALIVHLIVAFIFPFAKGIVFVCGGD